MKKLKKLIAATLALALLAGCRAMYVPVLVKEIVDSLPSGQPKEDVVLEEVTPNGLVLRLMELESTKAGEGNVILSPLSIEMALGMAANAADGDAKAALETLLGMDANQLNTLLSPYMTKGDDTLSIANSLWVNKNVEGLIRQEFKSALQKVYDAGEGSFTPGSKTDAAAINAWVKEKTRNKIDGIVSPNSLTDDTMALIINALYFNGKWTDPFEDWQVATEPFHAPTEDQTAQLMSDWEVVYFETEWGTGFSKTYEDSYEFIAMLPKESGAVDLSGLDIDQFLDSRSRAYDVHIKIPKFELEYSTSLTQTLSDLGLGSLFAPGSLNGMLTDKALAGGQEAHASDVIHKTYMKMYEEGTEAAAVTGIMVATTAIAQPRPQKEVFLDRPFAFLIRDTASGQVVFCGVINSVKK